MSHTYEVRLPRSNAILGPLGEGRWSTIRGRIPQILSEPESQMDPRKSGKNLDKIPKIYPTTRKDVRKSLRARPQTYLEPSSITTIITRGRKRRGDPSHSFNKYNDSTISNWRRLWELS
ncbi:hypothetical protein Salat_2427300 [Sesamum alatum]|uniref:Uncharacterized protein n=1 Tax=Sesamum alatum TaxID=300844 RepID=A0AAE1XY68_9LAMI|nr:hypothetical protein Salat_2427300 [Sesamum alatum]